MGLFGFDGKKESKPKTPAPKPDAEVPTDNPYIQLQINYWKVADAEKAELEGQGVERLGWAALLRLHHLYCLELLATPSRRKEFAGDDEEDAESASAPSGPGLQLVVTGRRLMSAESPYRPRQAVIWQRKDGAHETSESREPDISGVLSNASLSHLGAIELLKLDAQMQPVTLGFVGLDEIRGMIFAGRSLFRGAKLFYDDGRPDEIVTVPLLYGPSWNSRNKADRDGTLTRFCHQGIAREIGTGIGIGHQDWMASREKEKGGFSLFGIGSVNEVMVALEMSDPKFDVKCRARGLDPAEIRRRAGGAAG